ncbi:hypothetical protein BGX31_003165, partial [Mortierella sp. GBA43]
MEQSNDQADKTLQPQQQQQPSPPDEGDHLDRGDENEMTLETPDETGGGLPSPTTSGTNYPPADKDLDKLTMSERMMK